MTYAGSNKIFEKVYETRISGAAKYFKYGVGTPLLYATINWSIWVVVN